MCRPAEVSLPARPRAAPVGQRVVLRLRYDPALLEDLAGESPGPLEPLRFVLDLREPEPPLLTLLILLESQRPRVAFPHLEREVSERLRLHRHCFNASGSLALLLCCSSDDPFHEAVLVVFDDGLSEFYRGFLAGDQ